MRLRSEKVHNPFVKQNRTANSTAFWEIHELQANIYGQAVHNPIQKNYSKTFTFIFFFSLSHFLFVDEGSRSLLNLRLKQWNLIATAVPE